MKYVLFVCSGWGPSTGVSHLFLESHLHSEFIDRMGILWKVGIRAVEMKERGMRDRLSSNFTNDLAF